ncbi:acyl-CoA dehydrogenase family protein [Candidatus Sumerlaeota bacterium]|nr:acyl-CoA dehydrogenase family protein [Candidatus Sumerlaeota bacterium]
MAEKVRNRVSLRNRVEKKDLIPFNKALKERGWMAPGWSREQGGAGLSLSQQVILNEEMVRVNAPPIGQAITRIGPLIMEFGTEEQKARFLPKILEGEEIWCQGYSEPNAGSDLASLGTRADLDGDDFVLNGQKIWTSMAFEADWMYILVRTNPDAPKRQSGISFLFMSMKSPGIRIHRIKQITGESDFCEVFLDNVRVPRANLLGAVNDGWGHAKRILEYERMHSYNNYPFHKTVLRLIDYTRKQTENGSTMLEDAAIRRRLAQSMMEADATVYLGYRVLTRMLRGQPPGPEGSVIKLFASEALQRVGEISVDVQGPKAQLWGDPQFDEAESQWPIVEVSSRSLTLARGTSEIQRNIIAERVLGLPR